MREEKIIEEEETPFVEEGHGVIIRGTRHVKRIFHRIESDTSSIKLDMPSESGRIITPRLKYGEAYLPAPIETKPTIGERIRSLVKL